MQEAMYNFIMPIGMNVNMIYFLLIIPFISLLGTIVRHIIGVKTMNLGVLASMIFVVGFSIYDSSLYSLIFGGLIILFIYFAAYSFKKLTVSSQMHYYGRISFVLTALSTSVLLASLFLYKLDYVKDNINYLMINPFSIVIAVILGEQFSSHQIQKGLKTSRALFINTLIIALFLGFLFSINSVERFIIANPYLILIALILNFFVGSYQGMRLSEMLRFQSVAKSDYLEKDNE